MSTQFEIGYTKLDCLGASLVQSPALTRSIEENGLSLPRKRSRSNRVLGRVLFGPKSQNSVFSAPMARFMV